MASPAAPPRALRHELLHHAAQILPGLFAAGLAVYALRSVDLGRVLSLIAPLGFRLPLLLLPNLAVTMTETVGWWLSFRALDVRPAYASLLRVRLAAEAVMLGLPSGAVISESLQPYLLKHRADISFETAVVAVVGRKFLVVVSHGIVLVLVTLLAWPVLAHASRETIGRGGLPWLLLGAGLFLIMAFGLGIAAGAHVQISKRLGLVLGVIGGRAIGRWVERNTSRFERADEHLVRFFARERAALVLPMLLHLGGWIVRALETLLFLHLLGVRISLTMATVVESTLVLVRSLAVPVPAGLGVQDVGYLLAFHVLGVPDVKTVGAAFLLLKRSKDLFWILVGFALLGLGRRRSADTAAQRS